MMNHPKFWFEQISQIPRGSLNEKEIAGFLVEFANKHQLSVVSDDLFNVLIRKPGQHGGENSQSVLLQGHTDMVCEKAPDSNHDFTKDPIELIEEEGWLRANHTTLGADDGFAVAYMLALLENSEIKHPPLECLFTAAEEIGLLGAVAFDATLLKSKRCIGLDSGGENRTVITSSGGVRGKAILKIEKNTVYPNALQVFVEGAIGGHSGIDIAKQRANAAILLATVAFEYYKETGDSFGIIDIQVGKSENAIPFAGEMILGSQIEFNQNLLEAIIKRNVFQFEKSDPNVRITYKALEGKMGFDALSSMNFIRFAYLFFQGVQWMSLDIQGLPLLSANLGYLKVIDETLVVGFSFRSPISDMLDQNIDRVQVLADLLSLDTEFTSRYPGYPYEKNSPLRNMYQQWFLKHTGHELKLEASHGGLELGIWKGAIPDLDIITMGPIHELIHTFNEKMSLASFDIVYQRLCAFLGELSDVT
ncbi:MAG: beta-Ala-His dipeptidase [Erysipelotrichaceae bacterium]|nr:beta-Ala-His dipeptidase [Erysipelotrichaceae bacterium]